MTRRRVLVVEDELTIAESVAARLRAEGFDVELAHDGPTAVRTALADPPDLVVLDVMLPGFDGLEVCRRIHAVRPIPVLMLTARDDEADVLTGLAVGADDYLTKPFSIRELAARVHVLLRRVERAGAATALVLGDLEIDEAEGLDTGADDYLTKPFSYVVLVARVRALLRRRGSGASPVVRVGALAVDRGARRGERDGDEVCLTAKEFSVLEHLAMNGGDVVSKADILEHVWDFAYDGDPNIVEVYVSALRRKLGPGFIDTVRGAGYRLRA